MTVIKVLCLDCNQSFEFSHPSATNAKSLINLTIDCSNCGAVIKMAENHIVMESVASYMRRQLVPIIGQEAADAAQITQMEFLPDCVEVKVPENVYPFRGKDDGYRTPTVREYKTSPNPDKLRPISGPHQARVTPINGGADRGYVIVDLPEIIQAAYKRLAAIYGVDE